MKHLLTISGMLLATFPMFSQYNIDGHIDKHDGRILLISTKSDGSTDTIGNTVTANGTFNFKGTVNAPETAEITIAGTRLRIPVFLEKGYSYHISADIKNPGKYTITGGGELQNCAAEFLAAKRAINNARDSISADYKKQYGPDDPFWNLQLRGELEKIDAEYELIEDSLIKKYDNIVSAYFIASRANALTRNKTIHQKYNLLGENARNSTYGLLIKPLADKIANIITGATAPDFKMPAPSGEIISLHELKGKIKILDFWASWCGPCRAETPNIRNLYEKYNHEGLEILSISLDSEKEAWIKAIEEDKMTWKHASDLGDNKTVKGIYNIYAIPYMFILDENNKIIAEGLRGEKLKEFIDKQFAK